MKRGVVVDYKKREQWLAGRLPHPDDNDQLFAYALGAGLTHFQTCLLLFGDGKVDAIWSKVYTPENTGPILERIKQICTPRTDEPKGTSGDHCGKCWPRIHCPHWAARAWRGLDEKIRPTWDNGAELILAAKAMEEQAKRYRELCKDLVDYHGGFRVGSQEYRRVMMPGKVLIDGGALDRDGLYEQYALVGRAFPTYRLCRPEKEE